MLRPPWGSIELLPRIYLSWSRQRDSFSLLRVCYGVIQRRQTTPTLGDILRVRCDPTRDEPGVLVLSHMDTVHPVGTLAGKLACMRAAGR
jgi:hypothetical protein